MEIINSSNLNLLPHSLVATIGFFDGVHLGHKYLIEQLEDKAALLALPTAVITFSAHPRKVLNSEFQPALLCGLDEKLEKLSHTNIDYCIVLDFSKEMSEMSAKNFIQKELREKLKIKALLIGYDHRFGHNRADGFDEYKKYGEEVGLSVFSAKELNSDSNISSSHIRTCLQKGDIFNANKMLGYRYTISGKIVEGYKVGRTIGFPTANIQVWEDFKVVPAFGVYAVHVWIENIRYAGMLYIGKRPTLHNGENTSLEVNIFNFDGDLYGKSLSVEFLEFVRHDVKFENVDKLKKQINADKLKVIDVLTHYQ